jgi:ferredoxin-NADP reductase
MIKLLDRFLDRTTMYRLVAYVLAVQLVAALVFSWLGLVPHSAINIGVSFLVVAVTAFAGNWVFARVFATPANSESSLITVLIVTLIMAPVAPTDVRGMGALACASIWAIASKFILAAGGKHIFNPAAAGVALTALLLNAPATWWVAGNMTLMPAVLIGGFLIVRKLRRVDSTLLFIAVNLATILLSTAPDHYATALRETLASSPLFFFATVMLTEPLTAPARRWPRLVFAALVGFLAAPSVHLASFYFTPETALLVGNAFAFAVNPKRRLALTLERIEQAAADSYDFIFSAPRRLAFEAGQYLEWTLPVPRGDARGNRRYFTVASAPTEEVVRLGVKFYREPSAFKRALASMQPGDVIHAGQLAGDFTLPRDRDTKLAFLAGGIGITPFRSMLRHMVDVREARDTVVLYAVERRDDIAYRDLLDEADRTLGTRTTYAVARDARAGEHPGYIDEALILGSVPDYRERTFFVSGPPAMVNAVRKTLRRLGVQRRRIRVDFFPGLA